MKTQAAKRDEQLFSCKLPKSLIARVRLEAMRSRMTIRTCVANAPDSQLPRRLKIVVER